MRKEPLLAAALAASALAGAVQAQVYKCPDGKGGHHYTDKACGPDSQSIKTRASGFGGSKRSAEVSLQGQNCAISSSGRYTTATGYVVNGTGTPKGVRVTTTFTYQGTVIDTTSRDLAIPAWGRTPFQMIGGPGRIDNCEWQYNWD